MDKKQMRALVAIINDLDVGLSPAETLKQVAKAAYEKFPDLTVQELTIAFEANSQELELQAQESADEAKTSERIAELIVLAETQSGRSGMNAETALPFLAERGNEEARAILAVLTSPEYVKSYVDAYAAVAADPHWHYDGEKYWCDDEAEHQTIEALVFAYRQRGTPASD